MHFDVPAPPCLSEEERARLLKLVPLALEHAVSGEDWRDALQSWRHDPPGALEETAGVFVTLYEHDQLRGCIGQVASSSPLWETTAEMAVAAATRDPRFEPVDCQELADLKVEISVLGPLVSVPHEKRDPLGEFVAVGVHGIQLRHGQKSGLLLPQVAERYGWTPVVFLEETARKAGLGASAWKQPDTDLLLFQALKFGEEV